MFLHPFYMRWGGGPCGASCCPEASPGAVRAPQRTVHEEGWRGGRRKRREEGDEATLVEWNRKIGRGGEGVDEKEMKEKIK